jgi:hypothetical protein
MAATERLVLLAHRDEKKQHRAQLQQDAWQKAAYRLVPLVSSVLWIERGQQVAPLQVLMALPQAQSSLVQRASRPAAPQLVQEPAPLVPLAQPQRAPRVQLAWPLAEPTPQERSASRQLAQRSLAELPQAQQVSSAQPLRPRPSLLYPLWQPLLLALPLRPLPESSCAPSPRRPRGSSSSASSFPRRRTPATDQ